MPNYFARSIYWCIVLALVSSVCSAQDPAASRRALNLVTRDVVRIARPTQVVWPMIVHVSAWKKAVKMQHAGGPIDAVGEIFAARTGDADSPIQF
jgi:hypothetical protein